MAEGTTLAIALTAAITLISTVALISTASMWRKLAKHEERLQMLERQGATDAEWKKNIDSKIDKVVQTLEIIQKAIVKE